MVNDGGNGGDMTETVVVMIREYDDKTDRERVEQVESSCEVGPNGELSLYTDLLGDPICRVRNSPAYLMLVRIPIYIYLYISPSFFCFQSPH